MPVTAAAADARWRFGLFSALLAVALLLHQIWWDGFELWSLHAAVALAAAVVLLQPAAVGRVLVLFALESASIWHDMPGAGSHTLLAAVCGATVLASAGWSTLRTRRLPEAGDLFERAAPFLRVSVLLLYTAAVLAKLNSGFFDPAVSCAAAMAPTIAWFDPTLLDAAWLGSAAIYGTVLTEAGLPMLLAVRRTRVAGLVVGTGFHLVLALAGNVPFTALVFALYIAFLPAGAMSRLRAGLPHARLPAWWRPVAFAAFATAWRLGALVADGDPAGAREAIGTATRLLIVAGVAVAASAAVVARRTPAWPPRSDTPGLRLGHPVFSAGLAVLVFNALTPYVGLKTESSFAMFSNLQTETGYWNHALLPEAVRVFDHQAHLVTVTASNDPALLRRTRGGTRMVRFEVERYLRAHPGAWATLAPGGAARTAGPPLAPLVDKVAKFRDVRAPGRRGC